MRPSSSTTAILLFFISLANGTCFLPNGTANPSLGAAPCSSDPSNPLSAVCCNTKWSNPPGGDLKFGQPQDECMPNGLCQNRGMSTKEGEEMPPWTHFYRVYCADEGGEGCVGVCDSGLNADNVVQMTPCDGTATSEKWCCGDKANCCDAANAHRAVYVPKKLGDSKIPPASFSAPVSVASSSLPSGSSTSTSPSNPTPAAASASSNPSQQSTTNSPTANTSDSDDSSRKIGLGVGLGLGIPAILALGIVLGMFVVKRKGREEPMAAEVQNNEVGMGWGQGGVKRQATDDTMELETPVSELWGDRRVKAELE